MLRVSPQKLNLVAAAHPRQEGRTALAELEFSRKRISEREEDLNRDRQRREQP
jgi:ribosomal protein L22